jgi:hypothetical protein
VHDESSDALLLGISGIDWAGYRRTMFPQETCLGYERTDVKIKELGKYRVIARGVLT